MKSLMLLLIMTAIVGTSAMAQKQKDHNKDRAEWDKKVKDELKLTSEQEVKYEALCKEYNDKMDVVMHDASLSKDAQKERKMALKKEKQTKLYEFLTPEQQTKYNDLVEKKKKEKESKPGY